MLEQLVRYAERKRLVVEPGFAPKSVRLSFVMSERKGYLNAYKHSEPREFERAPEMSFSDLKALKGGGAHFLIDTLQVVTLLGVDDLDDKERRKIHEKHASFNQMLRDASRAMPSLTCIGDALEDPPTLERMRADALKEKLHATDKVTFQVGQQYPVEADDWHDWWRQFRASIRPGDGEPAGRPMRCFATGELAVPAATHPKITGLADVGAISMGAPLIGFDKEAFLSYGLKQSENGAVSEIAASKYRAALNYLIQNNSRRLSKMKVVYWYNHDLPPGVDPVRAAIDGAAEAAGEMHAGVELYSPVTSIRGDIEKYQFYSVVLSGAAGRVMVRDWTTLRFGELSERIDRWHKDLEIVAFDGTHIVKRVRLAYLVRATVRVPKEASRERKADDGDLGDASQRTVEAPAETETSLWRCLIRDLPIPAQLMAATVGRVKLDIINGDELFASKLALLKAYHVRRARIDGRQEREMRPMLDVDRPEAAYHCGRLVAVLAALQRSALGDVGAGVIQRFYAAASATPALVLGRLVRLSQFHLGTLQQSNPGLRYWYETRIAEIMDRIDTMPRTLNVESQSLFALGYYQQIANDRASKANKAATTAQTTPAPDGE